MPVMTEHLSTLEENQDLEADIIQKTKVNKLLKVILKLTTIPRDEEFGFKERCEKLLKAWNVILQKAEEEAAPENDEEAAPAETDTATAPVVAEKNGSIEHKAAANGDKAEATETIEEKRGEEGDKMVIEPVL
jgi:hypothetical protein